MNNKLILCEWCGMRRNEIFISKHKSGRNYCDDCKSLATSGILPEHIRSVSQKEFDKKLLTLINTPPLKLKDLKKQLKKEREEKQNSKSKK
jgi:hypothetical protein